ncbi:MAG: efflux RND transporter periplasmic adaptor subunit [Myxococcales bacterium]|nr:efflux RND transporter periplasmic adaptor subunit [Myxococcales bacterium]MDH5306216.1 efflux RND transporter periplasmic adaptor subunit [Myxococcales bacterium]
MQHAPTIRSAASIRARGGTGAWMRARTLGCGLALALPALACGSEDAGPAASAPPVVVEVMRVDPQPLVDVAVFSGQLESDHSVMVKPEIEGMVASIEFEEGQSVEADAVLFTLRSAEQIARLREAEATRDLARTRWDRAKQLVSRDASSLAARDVARAELEIAEARVDLARLELERTRIRAPFDGVLGRRLVDLGARVEQDTELVRVDAVERLQLTFGIPDEGLSLVRVGMPVRARVRPYPEETFAGEVFFVSPTLDPRNRRIWIKAWIPNAEGRLRPGLFANVDLELRRIESALVVPESAVAVDRLGPYVWRVDAEGVATRQPVELGLREGGVVEVVRGLRAGTSVVTAGAHKVSEGATVQASTEPLVVRAPSAPPEASAAGEGT